MADKKALPIFLTILFFPALVFAVDYGAWFSGIISRVIDLIAWPIFWGIAVLGTVYVGIKFLMSGGDPGKFKEAGKALMWVIIGIIIALLSTSIVVTLTGIIAAP